MQKKSPLDSASIIPRTLVVLLVCAAACLIATRTLPAFLRSEAPANLSQRTLSFAERVAYQRAIEDVYWRHRIWPKERPDPKPSLDAVMSQVQLEKKVADYLRKSQALEDYRQRPITAEQLQAEMDRMAKHTRQPEVLREVFDALGNDPFVIAECLARPTLAERLLTSWYAYDQYIHGELKERAAADLQEHATVEQIKQTSGKYYEIELVKKNEAKRQANGSVVKLSSSEWDKVVRKIAGAFNPDFGIELPSFGVQRHVAALEGAGMSAHSKKTAADGEQGIPVARLSSLREDEIRLYAVLVYEKSDDYIKIATVSWLKLSLETWLTAAENQTPRDPVLPNASYTLPNIATGGCIEDTWTPTAGAPSARIIHTAVWTGSEMIIWGGYDGSN